MRLTTDEAKAIIVPRGVNRENLPRRILDTARVIGETAAELKVPSTMNTLQPRLQSQHRPDGWLATQAAVLANGTLISRAPWEGPSGSQPVVDWVALYVAARGHGDLRLRVLHADGRPGPRCGEVIEKDHLVFLFGDRGKGAKSLPWTVPSSVHDRATQTVQELLAPTGVVPALAGLVSSLARQSAEFGDRFTTRFEALHRS